MTTHTSIKIFWICLTLLSIFIPSQSQVLGPLTFQDFSEIRLHVDKLIKFLSEIHEPKVKDISSSLSFLHEEKKTDKCLLCIQKLEEAKAYIEAKSGLTWISYFMASLCSVAFDFKTCKGYFDAYAPVILDAMASHYLSGNLLCSLIDICPYDYHTILNPDDYARELLKDKPQVQKPPIDVNAPIWKVLHISDLHIDLLYTEGSDAFCSSQLCCRHGTKEKVKPESRAGKWGTISKCDVPLKTVESIFEQVVKEEKPDFLLWTGDNPSHDAIDITQEDVYKITRIVRDMIIDKFNNTIPVYPTIGNHEKFPNDEYNPFNFTEMPFLKNLGDIYKVFLTDEAYESFIKYGYYSQKHLNTNLRIVATNCLLCDTLNYNLIRNPTDPGNGIAWLERTLREAEANKEVVYLLQHIPTAESFFLSECSKRYQALYDRFSHIIRGNFHGHTPYDELRISHEYFNKNKTTILGFVTPAVTTFPGRSPSYRIYEVDSKTKYVTDYVQYSLNLTKANLNFSSDFPRWDVRYRATENFNVSWLNETERIEEFIMRFDSHPEVFHQVVRNFVAENPKIHADKSIYIYIYMNLFRNCNENQVLLYPR